MATLSDENREELRERGWTVVPSVLPPATVGEVRMQMLDFYRRWNPKILDPDVRTVPQTERVPLGDRGLCSFEGHQRFCWTVRTAPMVARVFADIYSEDDPHDMLTSFDGFWFLPAVGRSRSARFALQAHVEGHTESPSTFVPIEGAVMLWHSNPVSDDGHFMCWERSHQISTDALDERPTRDRLDHRAHRKYPAEFLERIERDGSRYVHGGPCPAPLPMPRRSVRTRAGDLLLWHSNLAHHFEPPAPNAERHFGCVLVSMAPRRFAIGHDLERRIDAFEELRTSTHWPVVAFRVRDRQPHTYSADERNYMRDALARVAEGRVNSKDELNHLGRRLVGY